MTKPPTNYPGMATVDYVVDFLLCMLFTYISLGFSYLVFKILPFRTSYVWVIVYASCLLTLNNLVAFGMTLCSIFCGWNRQRASWRTDQHEGGLHILPDSHFHIQAFMPTHSSSSHTSGQQQMRSRLLKWHWWRRRRLPYSRNSTRWSCKLIRTSCSTTSTTCWNW